MSPRRYRSDRRKAATEDTRRKIVENTTALHAEHGVLATSYAMIAKRADVAVPTVYNHFPTRGDIVRACTGHVAALAPHLGPEIYDGAEDCEARLRALVRAIFATYVYYAPWMRWGNSEAERVPELAAWKRYADETRRELIELALAPAFGTTPPPDLLALCQALLDFPAWQRLAGEEGLDPAGREAALAGALITLVAARRRKTPNR